MLLRIKLFLVTAFFVILGIFGYGEMKRREGKISQETEDLKADANKREEAREAAFKEKRDVDGLSDSDLVDRLRRRGDDWGSL